MSADVYYRIRRKFQAPGLEPVYRYLSIDTGRWGDAWQALTNRNPMRAHDFVSPDGCVERARCVKVTVRR